MAGDARQGPAPGTRELGPGAWPGGGARRDTPDAIRPFVKAFHPRFVGLTGDEDAVADAMKRYGIYARRVDTRESTADADYLVDHFAVYYLFGPDGEQVAFVPHGSGVEAVRGVLETYVR